MTTAARTAPEAGWLPSPLVGWDQLAALTSPGKPASRSRVRTLRKNGRVSAGVKVYRRGTRAMQGAASYHSVLSVWAERARQLGHQDDADRLAASATELEQRFADAVRTFLAGHEFGELPQTDFFWAMAQDTARVLVQCKTWHESVLATATVTAVDGGFAHLEGRAVDGSPRSVDLPRRLLEHLGLATGDHVFVLSWLLGPAAVVELDPAFPPHADNELTDPSAERHARGPGAPLTAEEASSAWAAARGAGLTARPLRPAG